jgi:hypothetical protein
MLNPIDLNKEGFDEFLRHINTPFNKKIPLTYKDVFAGEKTVQSQGNVQARSVNRVSVGLDVLLTKFDFSLTNVKQISTGYDWTLNNFIYAVTWDGVNFYLRRYNAIDFAVPVQDGYSVNIPSVNNIYGVAVLYDRVVVIGSDTGGNKAFFYDFNLDYKSLETKSAPSNPITSTLTSNGIYLYSLLAGSNVLKKYDRNYQEVASYSWPTGQYSPTPNRLLCYDRRTFWAYDTTNKKVVRFQLDENNNQITVLYAVFVPEDVVGIMFLKGAIYFSYQQGQILTSVPLII